MPEKRFEVRNWARERAQAFGRIEALECLCPMAWYYRRVVASIRHLAGDSEFRDGKYLARMNFDQVREIRRNINTDLHNYSIEFYLQRRAWALELRSSKPKWKPRNPSQDPRLMRRGFRAIVDEGVDRYPYLKFLSETEPLFVALHAHLVSINRALGDLHYFATELSFSEFTAVGKSEILHLTSELGRVMTGLLAATHLQPRTDWQADLVSYLVSCRTDCQRFLDTIPRYYQSHRLRLVVFPIDRPTYDNDPEQRKETHGFPVPCLPGSAGVYMDFLASYQNIAQHAMAVMQWALRLYSLWYFVPRRVLRAVSPVIRG